MECLQWNTTNIICNISRSLPNNFLSTFYCIYKVSNSLPKTIKYRQQAGFVCWCSTSKQNHSYGDIACSSCRACTVLTLSSFSSRQSVLRTQQFINNGAAGMGSTSLYWSPSQWRCGEHILLLTSQVLAHRPRDMTWHKESTFQRDKQSKDWQPCCLDPLGCWETNDPWSGLQTLTL